MQPAPPTGSGGWSHDSSSARARGTQGTLWALFSPGTVRPAREDGPGRGQRAWGPRAVLHQLIFLSFPLGPRPATVLEREGTCWLGAIQEGILG